MISFFVIIHLVLIYIHLYCSLSPSSTINITEKKSFFPLFLLINLFGIFHPQSSFPAAVNSLKGRATSLATNNIFKDPINQKKILTQSCPHSITYWSREQIFKIPQEVGGDFFPPLQNSTGGWGRFLPPLVGILPTHPSKY